jgi:hypothetical protein
LFSANNLAIDAFAMHGLAIGVSFAGSDVHGFTADGAQVKRMGTRYRLCHDTPVKGMQLYYDGEAF